MRFIENISGVFPHLERRIYTYILSVAASALAMIDIPFRTNITNRTRFMENISAVFPHLGRRIYTFSIYTLSDLGVLSNLIGSLSLTNEHYSPPRE